MKDYQIYKQTTRPIPGSDWHQPELVPVMKLTANSAADAIRIAKQKGVFAPIVGDVK